VDLPVPAYQQFWAEKRFSLKTEYKDITDKNPTADPKMQQLFKVLSDIENLANSKPKQGVGCYNHLSRRQPREILQGSQREDTIQHTVWHI
jgi:hypothetical protein